MGLPVNALQGHVLGTSRTREMVSAPASSVLAMDDLPERHVRLALPEFLWGGDPEGLVHAAELRSRRQGDHFLVQTAESYERRAQPGFITARRLAGSGAPDRIDDLSTRSERAELSYSSDVVEKINKRGREFADADDWVSMANYFRLACSTVPLAELPGHVRAYWQATRETNLQEDSTRRPFADAGVQLLEVSPALHHRLKLASIWLRMEHDPRLRDGDTSQLKSRAVGDDGRLFASSAALYDGIFLLDAYIGPLMSCLSPGVWSVHAQRTFGSLLVTLGQPLAGTAGDAVEPLQIVTLPGADEVVPMPDLPPHACASAVNFWTGQLDQLLGVVSDPSVFADNRGVYDASSQLHALLTLEQIFRRSTSLLVAHRDLHARRALAFSVLDSIERLSRIDLVRMCTLNYAEKTYRRLESQLPGDAAQVLLPNARRGLDALRDLQDGFFLVEQLGLTGIPKAQAQEMTKESAAAHYLQLLRDATHGHGGRGSKAQQTELLLAHHDGKVPHNIGLLAYLYLLDLLVNPSRLETVLSADSRRYR